jgi:hypothetical protein
MRQLRTCTLCWSQCDASAALQSPDDRPDFETVIGRLRRMLAVETLARQPSGAQTAATVSTGWLQQLFTMTNDQGEQAGRGND